MLVPQWFADALKTSHPTLVVRWEEFPDKRTFILPYHGLPFFRWKDEAGTVWYQRWRLAGMTKVGRMPYKPDEAHSPSGCFVIRQPRPSQGDLSTVFDVISGDEIDDDGRRIVECGALVPLGQRILDAIGMRHDTDGEKWKEATEQIDESAEKDTAAAMAPINDQLEQTAFEAFKMATGIKQFSLGKAPDKPHEDSFTVIDKRRFAGGNVQSDSPRPNP